MAKLEITSLGSLEQTRTHYKGKIDKAAEVLRRRFITASPGQAMTYEAKHREASRYPQGNGFPFLEAEAASLGMTVQEVATSVLEARQQWESLGAQIEGARLKAKQQVRGAQTAAEMHAIAKQAFDGLQ